MEVNMCNIQGNTFEQFAFYDGKTHLTAGKSQLAPVGTIAKIQVPLECHMKSLVFLPSYSAQVWERLSPTKDD